MQNPVSRPTKLDTLRAAIASTGGQTALLQTLLEELEATRAERDALRQEKHGDKLEIEPGRVLEAGCWAHARRHFYDIHEKRPSAITTHALETIAELYRIEGEIRGKPPDERRAVRQVQSAPIVHALHAWLKEQLATVAKKSVTADAINYALNQWQALTRLLDDGRIEADNNVAERALRAISVGRKNFLFLGSDAGGERAATMYSLLGTAKLNDVNPEAYLGHVLERIADHPVNRIDELLPWNVKL